MENLLEPANLKLAVPIANTERGNLAASGYGSRFWGPCICPRWPKLPTVLAVFWREFCDDSIATYAFRPHSFEPDRYQVVFALQRKVSPILQQKTLQSFNCFGLGAKIQVHSFEFDCPRTVFRLHHANSRGWIISSFFLFADAVNLPTRKSKAKEGVARSGARPCDT